MPNFDFAAFEKEAAGLLAQMRATADRLSSIETEARSGRATTSQVESQVRGPSGATDESAVRGRASATEDLVARQRALSAAESDSVTAERGVAQAMAQSSANMRINGALTNEFVDEAKRGAVTVRELGQEVTGTIAKFGGWIVAGSAVYVAFDALTKIKAGAVDATSGVEQMSRVITNLNFNSATEEVSELAQKFNLPISTVTETAFGIGKAYHDQAQALLATKSALYAVKIGEIDAGTATRYLIGIINGFHLPAKDMASLFDELVSAQKHYAIDLPTLMSGVGRAAGAFKAAGGDVHTLISLITTLQHVSGQSGNVIGTAIQRSPHFINLPQNQSILRQFGIDPSQDITAIYNQAIKAASGKSGSIQRQIAEALFGPQYGSRVGIFLLQNKKLFNEVLNTTAPKHSKGTAENQLDITLQKTDERISKIGVSLETIGLHLAQGHFLDSLGLALELVNGILGVTNDLLGDFDRLPAGIQQSLAYLLQISLLLKVMRRFNVGESIAGAPGGAGVGGVRGGAARFLGYESPTAYAKQTREGFINEQGSLQKEVSRLNTQLYSATRRQSFALDRAGGHATDEAAAGAAFGATSPQAQAAQARRVAAEEESAGLIRQQEKLAAEQEYATSRLNDVQQSIIATRKKIVGGLDVERTVAEAERLGYPVPARLGKGGTEPPVVIGGEPAAQAGKVSAAAGAAATRVGEFSTKVGGVKGALGSLGNAFSGLLGRLGTLAIAAFTIGFISEQLVSQANSVGAVFDKIDAESGTYTVAHLKALKKGSEGGDSFAERLTDVVTERTNILGVGVPTLGLGPGKGIGDELREIEAGEAKNIENVLKLQRKASREGKPVPLRKAGDIAKDIEGIKKSHLGRKQVEDALEKYEEELIHSAPGPHQDKELAAARAALSNAKVEHAQGRDLVESLQSLKSSQIGERLQAAVGLLGGAEGVQFDPAEAKKLSEIYQAQVQKIGTATDAKSVQELTQARQQYFSGIQSAVQGELQYRLDLAKTPGDRQAAYAQASQRYRQFSQSSGGELKKQQETVKRLQKERDAAADAQKKELETVQGPGIKEGNLASTKTLKDLDSRLSTEKGKLKQITEQESQKQRFIRDILQKEREEEFQANSALRQAQESAKEALTANPIQQTEEKIEFLGQEIAQAIKVYGRDSQQVLQLITEQRQARQQLVQDQLGLLQAKGNLASAGILEQVPKEKATLYGPGGLLAQLHFEQEHSNAFDPKQVIELQAQIKQAEAQLTFDIQQEANQLADARYGIREAKAQAGNDPTLAAKIAVEKARYDVAHAQTPVEKLSAQQNLIQALTAKREAVANARVESITFEANIEKITTQQEIEQLEDVLRTQKLGLSAKRQLREQIHSLKNQLATEGEKFNLNVGDFSLPTAYDIRRALLGGTGGAPTATIHQTNSFKIDNHSSDPKVLGKAIGHALGRSAESAAHSAGVAG